MNDFGANIIPAAALVLPPTYRRFRPAGAVDSAKYSSSPLRGIRNPGSNTRAQKLGKRYEAKILSRLEKLGGALFRPAPWIEFVSGGSLRFCQPDGLWDGPAELFVLEIKYTHCIDAYFQLKGLYIPVLRALYPSRKFRLVEVTRSFDPSVRYPEEMELFFSMDDLLTSPPSDRIAVLQWKV